MLLDNIEAKQYVILRIALTDFIKKCEENQQGLTINDIKYNELDDRYNENKKVARDLLNRLS
ncbi:MAG TPA: hypothetical protein VNX01_16395 [Bacteroidia bacterium]|jgi:hypothetical protein|nr:hypothetical protein [Bacteroidia bacterium]